jgi:hypothetical protein
MAPQALQLHPEVLPGFSVTDVAPLEVGLIALRKNLEQVQGIPLPLIGLKVHQDRSSPSVLCNDDRLLGLMSQLNQLSRP